MLVYWMCLLTSVYRMNLMWFADPVNSLLLIFCSFSFILSLFFIFSVLKGVLSGLRQCLAFESSLKMMKNAFCLTLEAPFDLKMFKFLSWIFDLGEKRMIRKIGWFQNLWPHNLVNKQLQYTYRPISQEAKTIRLWNSVS